MVLMLKRKVRVFISKLIILYWIESTALVVLIFNYKTVYWLIWFILKGMIHRIYHYFRWENNVLQIKYCISLLFIETYTITNFDFFFINKVLIIYFLFEKWKTLVKELMISRFFFFWERRKNVIFRKKLYCY